METLIQYLLKFILENYLILVPALLFLGFIMKKSAKVKDTSIPWMLCLVGIFFALLITLATANFSNWQLAVGELTKGILQGILVTGFAVLISQLYIQKRKANEAKKESSTTNVVLSQPAIGKTDAEIKATKENAAHNLIFEDCEEEED